MSVSKLPAVIEDAYGRRSVEIEPGCRLVWCKIGGDRWAPEVYSDAHTDFIVVDRLRNQIRWPVQ
jgi:hypothetical protein